MSNTTPNSSSSWQPSFLDMRGLAHLLSTSTKQIQRLLAAGRLPAADVNLSGTGNSCKGRRWSREKILRWLEGERVS